MEIFTVEAWVACGTSFLILLALFWPMENVFSANPSQKTFRPEWFLDLCFFVGQYVLWAALVTSLLWVGKGYLDWVIPTQFRAVLHMQPFWVQTIEVVILSDLFVYWAHRFQHHNSFLWRFHKVHHSAKHLDWLAAHREHPLDSIYTIGIINLPAFIFDFPLKTILALIAFRGIWAIYIHSNVRMPIGKLRVLIGAPELHHWHHANNRKVGNYANISPLMDVFFGTYLCPPEEPKEIGIPEQLPQNYVGQLLQPLLPTSPKSNS